MSHLEFAQIQERPIKSWPMQKWGEFDGAPVWAVTISDGAACRATVLTYGAVLQSLFVPDREGHADNIALGLTSLQDYVNHSPAMGVIAGRNANRTADGLIRFPDGRTAQLECNEAHNHIHGGFKGTAKRNWSLGATTANSVSLHLSIGDRQDAYPGDFHVRLTYAFTKPNELTLSLSAQVSEESPINLAQHSYFNLGQTSDVLDHQVQINAQTYSVVDAASIPMHSASVEGTAFDFREPRSLAWQDRKLAVDHNFFSRKPAETLAIVSAADTGRRMSVTTSMPCVQFYAGHKLNVPVRGTHDFDYRAFAGLCLEPQFAPNSANQGDQAVFFGPDRDYQQTTLYKFETF